jgi:chemotaxis protein CheX
MTPTLRDSMHLVSDPESLDGSVYEVFEMMLGKQCLREGGAENQNALRGSESVTAVVGFGGILSGACVLSCQASAACRMAECLAGMSFDCVDDVVKDAIGEICNMVAGAWKSKVPDLAANCGLSVPAVITGSDYNLHVQAPEFKIRQTYSFEDTEFKMMIVCDGMQ